MTVAAEKPRTKVKWRGRVAVWCAGSVALVAVSWLLASNRVYQPPQQLDHARIGPTLASFFWILLPLLLLWTIGVGAGPAARDLRAREGSASLAGLFCIAIPVLLVLGYVAYDAAMPGCGSPYRSLLTPLPDGVEVVSEDSDFIGISGPGRYRGLIVRSDGASQEDLFQLLVDHYRELGWPLNVSDDVDGPYADAELGRNWWLDVDTGHVEDDATVSIELDHEPTTDRGCLRL